MRAYDDWLTRKAKELGFSKGDIVETKNEGQWVGVKLTGVVRDIYISENSCYLMVFWLDPEHYPGPGGNPGPWMVWPKHIRLVNDPEVAAMLALKYQGHDFWKTE